MSKISKPPFWAHTVATFFGLGWVRPGPGTWASAAALLIWAMIGRLLPNTLQPWVVATAAILVTAIGVPAATVVGRAWCKEDPSQVVIDEVAGQLIAFIAVPLSWKPLLAGFLLFRAFDILKPPPLRFLERAPEGVGVMLDDVGAGLYALLVMQLLLHYGFLR